MSSYYPIFLNLKGKRCVVVGGGQVALRKVNVLLEHQGDVLIISPESCAEVESLTESGKVRLLRREFQTGDLDGAWLAIAATDRKEINLQVAAEARKARVLVNVVDDAQNSDFILPSYFRRGDITIAVSTAGRSPALARKIRTTLEKNFGEEYARLTVLISEVRAETKGSGTAIDGDRWQEALDLDLLIDLIQQGKIEQAKNTLRENLKAKRK